MTTSQPIQPVCAIHTQLLRLAAIAAFDATDIPSCPAMTDVPARGMYPATLCRCEIPDTRRAAGLKKCHTGGGNCLVEHFFHDKATRERLQRDFPGNAKVFTLLAA